MARVDYNPFPDVEARTQAPDDLQHVEANPNAFGAQLATSVSDVGQDAINASKFYGTVAADHATNNTLQQVTYILHGNPNQMVQGPDGQMVPDTGYLGKRGADAMSAREGTDAAIDKVIQQQRSGLSTPEAQFQFDQDSRRYRAQWQSMVGEHADQQQRTWSIDTNNTAATLALNDLARNPGDDATYSNVQQRVRTALVRNAQMNGEDPTGAVLKADQAVALGQVHVLMDTNPITAPGAISKHMDVLAALPGTYQLMQEAKARAQDYLVGALSDPTLVANSRAGMVSQAPQSAPGTAQSASLADVQRAIIGQESGGNTHAPTSVDGARGIGQVTPATFERFAKPGEDINSPTDNQTVANRIVAHYYDAYHGDVGKIATAYFSGDGNVSHDGSTAWRHDAADGNGKTVSSYVSDIYHRLGLQGSATSPQQPGDDPYLLQVRQKAEAVFTNDPGAVENVVKRVEFNIKRDDSEQVAQVTGATNDKISYLMNGGDPAKAGTTAASITASLPGPKGVALANDFSTALDFANASKQIAVATPQQVQSILDAHKPTGPEDFQTKSSAYEQLQKAADARQVALFGKNSSGGDPAAYVSQYHPEIGGMLQGAIDGSSPNGLAAYIAKTTATQTQLGVPGEMQWVLPKSMATGIVHGLQTVQPQEALNRLSKLQAEAGSNWPVVYRDLARAGLPMSFQAPMTIMQSSPQNAKIMISALQRDADANANGKPLMQQEAHSLLYSGKPVDEQIGHAVDGDTGLNSLRLSLGAGGRGGVDQFAGVQQAVKSTALYLYLTGAAHDPVSAASNAARMITGNYDFVAQGNHSPVRLPYGMGDTFRQATQYTIDNLKPGDVRPYAGDAMTHHQVPNVGAWGFAEGAYQGARNAYWLTVPGPDGHGAVRAMDPASGHPVIMSNGRPLDIPFAQLKTIAAKQSSRDTYSATMVGGF